MLRKLLGDDRGQMGMDLPGVIIGVGIAIVAAIIVIYIGSEVYSSMSLTSSDPLYNASQSVQSGANDAFALLGPVFIIVMAAVAIAYLRMTRR